MVLELLWAMLCAGQPAPPDPSSEPTPPATTRPAPTSPLAESLILLPVRVNGMPAGAWLADTGATMSFADSQSIAAISTGATSSTTTGTELTARRWGGELQGNVWTANLLEFPSHRVEHEPLVLVDFGWLRHTPGWSLSGVLGLSTLGDAFRLDFARHRYEQGKYTPEVSGVFRGIWLEGFDVPVIWCEVNGKRCRLLVDTGSNETLLMDDRWMAANGFAAPQAKATTRMSIGAQITVAPAVFQTVDVLGREQHQVEGSVGRMYLPRADGMVGAAFLRSGVLEISRKDKIVGMRWNPPEPPTAGK